MSIEIANVVFIVLAIAGGFYTMTVRLYNNAPTVEGTTKVRATVEDI